MSVRSHLPQARFLRRIGYPKIAHNTAFFAQRLFPTNSSAGFNPKTEVARRCAALAAATSDSDKIQTAAPCFGRRGGIGWPMNPLRCYEQTHAGFEKFGERPDTARARASVPFTPQRDWEIDAA